MFDGNDNFVACRRLFAALYFALARLHFQGALSRQRDLAFLPTTPAMLSTSAKIFLTGLQGYVHRAVASMRQGEALASSRFYVKLKIFCYLEKKSPESICH